MAAVSPDTNMGASGDEADNSISLPSLSSTSPCRTDSPRREAVTFDDVADGLLDEYEARINTLQTRVTALETALRDYRRDVKFGANDTVDEWEQRVEALLGDQPR